MTTPEALHDALVELFSVANSAMTRSQRSQRAAPVLTAAGLTVADVIAAIRRTDLPWNLERARVMGVGADAWQQALQVAELDAVQDVGQLLDMLHRAEAAAAMLRAGYRPRRDASGRLSWAT
jgi:hypothetical protein